MHNTVKSFCPPLAQLWQEVTGFQLDQSISQCILALWDFFSLFTVQWQRLNVPASISNKQGGRLIKRLGTVLTNVMVIVWFSSRTKFISNTIFSDKNSVNVGRVFHYSSAVIVQTEKAGETRP